MIVSGASTHPLLMSTSSAASSSSGFSSIQQPAFDGIFRVPQLPSLRRFNGCNFCGGLTSQQGNGPLMQCDGCKITLYCSEEHKASFWKKSFPTSRSNSKSPVRSLCKYGSWVSGKRDHATRLIFCYLANAINVRSFACQNLTLTCLFEKRKKPRKNKFKDHSSLE